MRVRAFTRTPNRVRNPPMSAMRAGQCAHVVKETDMRKGLTTHRHGYCTNCGVIVDMVQLTPNTVKVTCTANCGKDPQVVKV